MKYHPVTRTFCGPTSRHPTDPAPGMVGFGGSPVASLGQPGEPRPQEARRNGSFMSLPERDVRVFRP